MLNWRANIHQSYFVIFLSVGMILGVVLALVFRINYFHSVSWLFLAGVIMVLIYFKPKLLFVSLALFVGLVIAFFRVSKELSGENYIRNFYGKSVVVSGKVSGDPETDEAGTKFKLRELEFGGQGGEVTNGSLYVSGYKNRDLERGDRVVLEGELSEGFGVYAGYLYKPQFLELAKPEPRDQILSLRNWFAERVSELIPDTQAKLGLSYLLGMKGGLPDELAEELRIVGLVHIVVASGAHLSILVSVARKIFGKLSRFAGVLFSVLFILFFMSMIGFTPSILRAGVMSILTLVFGYVGRKTSPPRIILIVAAMTLMINPMFVIDLGWLLSFASFGGIMILAPKIQKIFYGERKPGFISSIVITTLAATLMTLPIILYFYGQISLISVVANLVILPTLPYAMGLTFLVGVFYGVPAVETVVAFLATKLLDFHIWVVEVLSEMKSFIFKMPAYQPQIFLIYIVIFIWILFPWLKKRFASVQ